MIWIIWIIWPIGNFFGETLIDFLCNYCFVEYVCITNIRNNIWNKKIGEWTQFTCIWNLNSTLLLLSVEIHGIFDSTYAIWFFSYPFIPIVTLNIMPLKWDKSRNENIILKAIKSHRKYCCSIYLLHMSISPVTKTFQGLLRTSMASLYIIFWTKHSALGSYVSIGCY